MNPARFTGLGVCPGIVVGTVHLVDRRRVALPRYRLRAQRTDAELERLERAIVASELQLMELSERATVAGLTEVERLLAAHTMILRDRFLRDATRERITADGINAEWALSLAVKKVHELFDGLDEDYFRERRGDIGLVADRLLRNLIGAETELLKNLPPGAIVVAHDLSPADIVALARYQVRAFVTEVGGKTSHLAIFARSMKIPAILQVHDIVENAAQGDRIVVDGKAGEVILRPPAPVQTRFRALEKRRVKEEEALLKERHLPAETTDGERVALLGNVEVAEEAMQVILHGGEGIGLYRTEFLVLERKRMPSTEEHLTEYRRVLDLVNHMPLTIRTTDLGEDKILDLSYGAHGSSISPGPAAGSGTDRGMQSVRRYRVENPALGVRGIRQSFKDVLAFKDQLRAILMVANEGPVRILLPLVTQPGEVRRAREILAEVAHELGNDAPRDQVLLGVMIETPAAVFLADALCKVSDFFSIGTNDLIQYALAVDRRNDQVSYLYQPAFPGVLKMLKMVADAGERAGIPVNVCGEMAADPFHVPLLLGIGIRSLSMSAPAIPAVRRLVRRVSAAATKDLVARVIELDSTEAVEAELQRFAETIEV